MTRGLTRSQVDALGNRLRHQGEHSEEDLLTLQAIRAGYDAPMREAERVLRDDLRIAATSRLKTESTIIEKLRRMKTRLSSMQDIAGLRTVQATFLSEQDALVERIVDAFSGASVQDRRLHPSIGYRAVHVIVELDGHSVEIQVRTRFQDEWAQAFEKIADVWGRGIRYGEPPPEPEQLVGQLTVQHVIDEMLGFAADIARAEVLADEASGIERRLQAGSGAAPSASLRRDAQRLDELRGDLDELRGQISSRLSRVTVGLST